MRKRTCSDCGGPREHEFWARCNSCQRKASDEARRRLESVTGEEFASAVVDACHQVARDAKEQLAALGAITADDGDRGKKSGVAQDHASEHLHYPFGWDPKCLECKCEKMAASREERS